MLTYCTRLKFNNEQSLEVFVAGLEKNVSNSLWKKFSIFIENF